DSSEPLLISRDEEAQRMDSLVLPSPHALVLFAKNKSNPCDLESFSETLLSWLTFVLHKIPPTTMSKTYRVGVIGYGLSAKVFHIPFIQAAANLELGAIVQGQGDEAREQHPGCSVYKTSDELFADGSIDLVVLSTPPTSHFELAAGALNAGKHVVVEKPFCPTSAECDELITLAKSKGKLLVPFQNRRWDADYVTLQKVLSEGKLGRVVEFASHYDRYDPEVSSRDAKDAPGAGVIYDLGTHLLDQILNLYGVPSRVTGFLSKQRANAPAEGAYDACSVLLHYEPGPLVTVKATPISVGEEQLRFWVRGDKGSFKKYGIDPQEPQFIGGMKLSDPEFGVEPATSAVAQDGKIEVTTVENVPPPTYGEFYKLLTGALEGQNPVPVKAEEARDLI
ncbi:NAD binding Rossmann fold oxidoreductase, partial [Fusarium albosuccineum]